MAENTTNLFEPSFDAINAMKKKDLVKEIEKLKDKVPLAVIKKSFVIKYLVYQKILPNSCSQMKYLVASL